MERGSQPDRHIGGILDDVFPTRTDPADPRGVLVVPLERLRGQELDVVVLADASARAFPGHEAARRRLHLACSRARHALWLLAPGLPTPLVPEAAWDRDPWAPGDRGDSGPSPGSARSSRADPPSPASGRGDF